MAWLDKNKWFALLAIVLAYLAWAYRYEPAMQGRIFLDRWTGSVVEAGDLIKPRGRNLSRELFGN